MREKRARGQASGFGLRASGLKRSDASESGDLRALRVRRHRALPGLALRSPAEARAFVREAGIAAQTWDDDLPSLFAAANGSPEKPAAHGFAGWPEHAWSWPGEIGADGDVLECKVYRKKTAFFAKEIWPALLRALPRPDPRTPLEDEILARLAGGPVRADLLAAELGARSKEITRAKRALEERGAIFCAGTTVPTKDGGHTHTALLRLPEHVFDDDAKRAAARMTPLEARARLLTAALDAAVFAPERRVLAWFPLSPDEAWDALAAARADGRIVPVDIKGVKRGLVTARSLKPEA